MSVMICYMDITRTVKKSDFTPALALSKHMASAFDKNVERKKKGY